MNTTIKYTFVILLFIQIITSCTTPIDQSLNNYEDNFISFSFPKDWTITNVDTTQKDVKLYTIEETVNPSSFGIYIAVDNNQPIKNINFIQKNILEEYMPTAKKSETKDTVINGEKALYFDYIYKSILEYHGIYIALECQDKFININSQYALNEELRVKIRAQKVISSITCK